MMVMWTRERERERGGGGRDKRGKETEVREREKCRGGVGVGVRKRRTRVMNRWNAEKQLKTIPWVRHVLALEKQPSPATQASYSLWPSTQTMQACTQRPWRPSSDKSGRRLARKRLEQQDANGERGLYERHLGPEPCRKSPKRSWRYSSKSALLSIPIM